MRAFSGRPAVVLATTVALAAPAEAIGPGPIGCFSACQQAYHLCLATNWGLDLTGAYATGFCTFQLTNCLNGCSADLDGLLDAAAVIPASGGGGQGGDLGDLPPDTLVDVWQGLDRASDFHELALDTAQRHYARGLAFTRIARAVVDDRRAPELARALDQSITHAEDLLALLDGVLGEPCYIGASVGILPEGPDDGTPLSAFAGPVVPDFAPWGRPRDPRVRAWLAGAERAYAIGDVLHQRRVDLAAAALDRSAASVLDAADAGLVDPDRADQIAGDLDDALARIVGETAVRACSSLPPASGR